MTSRAEWLVSLGDLILAVALVVLFIELLKSTTSRRVAIINHSLSMILFIVCLVEFLLAPAFATSTFFLLTLMVLLDVLAGFIVTIVAARRDIDLTSGGV
jgi:predicted neutral ceramidase superfamily lipid hydrolase